MSSSTTIRTADPLPPGTVVKLNGEDLMRVTDTALDDGMWTSTVALLSAPERWRLRAQNAVRAVQSGWRRRVWWPIVDWVDGQREAQRRP